MALLEQLDRLGALAMGHVGHVGVADPAVGGGDRTGRSAEAPRHREPPPAVPSASSAPPALCAAAATSWPAVVPAAASGERRPSPVTIRRNDARLIV